MDLPYAIYWIAALATCVLGLVISLVWALRRPAYANRGLPAEWSLTARPVFTSDERRIFRLLREALPHHVVLSKLPLVRFCQPTEAKEVRYWFDLLGNSHVTFAVCSPNGRVLAAIDLDSERGATPRNLQIKQAVLTACRVRYLRCAADQLPSLAELQLLVPQSSHARGPLPAPAATRPLARRRPGLSAPMGHMNPMTPVDEDMGSSDWGQFSQPLPLWQDAGAFQQTQPQPLDEHPSAPPARRAAHPRGHPAGHAFERPQPPQHGGFADPDLYDEPPRRRLPVLPQGESRRRAPPHGLDAGRYPHTLPVLDDEDDDALMDDIVGVVVDAPRYADPRQQRG